MVQRRASAVLDDRRCVRDAAVLPIPLAEAAWQELRAAAAEVGVPAAEIEASLAA